MWEDPIVAEVHRTRERIAARFNYDLDAYFADIRRRQVALGDRLIPAPKKPMPQEDTRGENGDSGTSDSNPADVAPISGVLGAIEAILRQPRRVMFRLSPSDRASGS